MTCNSDSRVAGTTHTLATLVLIHGAFHSPACWRKLVPLLEKADVPYFLVDRGVPATSTRRAAVSWDPEGEAKQICEIIDETIGGPVVLVGHSKGGDAVAFGGNHEQVVQLVYLAAHVPRIEVPESITVTNPKLKEGFKKNDDRTWNLDPEIAKDLLYSDCDFDDESDALDTLSELLRPQAMPSISNSNFPLAYESKKSTYIVCARDETTYPQAQRYWARQLNSKFGCDIIEIPTGHSPFWSNPNLLAEQFDRHREGLC